MCTGDDAAGEYAVYWAGAAGTELAVGAKKLAAKRTVSRRRPKLSKRQTLRSTAVQPQIIDWDRSHPLLSSVELGNVDIADSLVLDPPAGATVLIDSTAGPIAAIAPRDAYQDAVLGFEIFGEDKDGARTVNTNWPRRMSFPTFWSQRAGISRGRDRRFANRVRRDRADPWSFALRETCRN